MDIHNCSKIVRQNYDNIQSSDKISEKNKEDIEEFLRFMEDRELSDSRKMRYLQSAKQILEYNDFRLKNADEERIRKIHRQIQDSDTIVRNIVQRPRRSTRSSSASTSSGRMGAGKSLRRHLSSL